MWEQNLTRFKGQKIQVDKLSKGNGPGVELCGCNDGQLTPQLFGKKFYIKEFRAENNQHILFSSNAYCVVLGGRLV